MMDRINKGKVFPKSALIIDIFEYLFSNTFPIEFSYISSAINFNSNFRALQAEILAVKM